MAKRIGVLEADEPQTAEPRSHANKSVAKELVGRRFAKLLGPRIIQMVRMSYRTAKALIRETLRPPMPKVIVIRAVYDGPLGVGNALPFSRQSDGKLLHYEMPHAGDIGLWRHFKKRISVSARSRFSHQSLAVPATHTSALALADALQG